jgi:transposase InsO family protein
MSTTRKRQRNQERKAQRQQTKQRKAKVYKHQVLAGRRRADRARREQRRAQRQQDEKARRQFRFRVRVVRYYYQLRRQDGMTEQRAVELTVAKYRPRKKEHQPLSASTLRNWVRQVKQADGNYGALWPHSHCPHQITYHVSETVVSIIFTLRHQLGWGGHRIAKELKKRAMAQVSGRTVYKIFDRLSLPIKLYALKGRSDGIAYQRYEKGRPNAQWHIDLKYAWLADGTQVFICVLVDDYSRYAVAAVAGLTNTTEWVSQVARQAFARAGQPAELVSDNGREFASVWENSLTKFGQLLVDLGIQPLHCAPYYPQGNGKAEAFIKTLDRELLTRHIFNSLDDLQAALDRYLTFYNNYRLHSRLGWQAPVTRYAGRPVAVQGLAGIPGVEPMAANPKWGPASCDPPVEISPRTAAASRALVPLSDGVSTRG